MATAPSSMHSAKRDRIEQLIADGATVLAEGSVYELLRRDPQIRFDPQIAHAALVYDDSARARLQAVHSAYLEIARRHRLPIIAFADTWRASAARVEASPFRGRNVNRDNVEFLARVVDESNSDAFVAALTGPRGDAYRPEEAPDEEEAMKYHAAQVEELAGAGADLLVAATLPSFDEARGIARLFACSGCPWMLSFVVRPSGVLLDGTPLGRAIDAIDAAASRPPAGFSINCTHPDIARQALATLPESSRKRIVLFQGNTSARTPEELDNLPFVESTAPDSFAASVAALMRESSVRMVGGCCGTDESHIEAVACVIEGDMSSRA